MSLPSESPVRRRDQAPARGNASTRSSSVAAIAPGSQAAPRAGRTPTLEHSTEKSDSTTVHDRILRQVAALNRNMYILLCLIREMDQCGDFRAHGCVTLRQYIQLTCGVNECAARERIRVALALGRLPAIDAAIADGRLSYSKVRAITRVASPDNEEEWLEQALECTAEELEVTVTRSQSGTPRERRLRAFALDRHSTRMIVDLPTEEFEIISLGFDVIRKAAGARLCNTQALVYMAANTCSGDVRNISTHERYTVVVHADRDGTAWAETAHGNAPIRPQVVERLLCDCSIRLAREETDGSETVSKRQRTISTVTRRAVEIRDRRRCRVPGCANRLWLDAHHRKPRAQGGHNTRRNLVLLCTQHHQLCHDGALEIIESPTGELEFRASDGWILGAGGTVYEGTRPDERERQRSSDLQGEPMPDETSEQAVPHGDGTLVRERCGSYRAGGVTGGVSAGAIAKDRRGLSAGAIATGSAECFSGSDHGRDRRVFQRKRSRQDRRGFQRKRSRQDRRGFQRKRRRRGAVNVTAEQLEGLSPDHVW